MDLYRKKLRPETAEEIEATKTIEGMWQRITDHEQYNHLIHYAMCQAKYVGLSREDTAILLAFNAIAMLEGAQQCALDELMRRHNPLFVVDAKTHEFIKLAEDGHTEGHIKKST